MNYIANARKLPSGNWRVQAKSTIDGKKVCRSFTDSSEKKAKLKALEWQTHCCKENEFENISLKNAYSRYISSKKNVLSPSTIREYVRMSNNYLQDIMEVKIDHLTQERIQISINNESKSHSPKTIRNIHGLLSAVLLMFDLSFVLHTTLPQKKEITMNIPDDYIVSKLLKAIKGTKIELPVLLATFGALRRGEICALNVDDLKGNILTINKSLAHSEDGEWIMKSPKPYQDIEA